MKLNELKPNAGSTKNRKRVGRGMASGTGKTAGSGQKGQKARSGVAIKGFEGGQMPLYRRLPKRGFNSPFSKEYAEVNLSRLQIAIDDKKLDAKKEINVETLIASGVVRRELDGVKLLATGEIKAKINITVTKASKTALEAVEKAGGKVTVLPAKEKWVGKKYSEK